MANIFPSWSNQVPLKAVIALLLLGTTVAFGIYYYYTNEYMRVGYQPVQPVAFDHYLHVEQLGMDCRYCHTYVDRSEHSNVPTTETCYSCHGPDKGNILARSDKLSLVRESYASGEPIPWVRIHRTPDYVYFSHKAHVNRGISCYECHGQINKMQEVYHAEPLSMNWCLECHRNPEQFVRPPEEVYNLNWRPESEAAQIEQGTKYVHDWKVNPPQSCSGCHR